MDMPFQAYFNNMRRDVIEWDDYFMAIAKLSALRSKDPCTQVGAVLVNESNRIVGIGYNGFPRPCKDDVFPWYKQRKTDDGRICIVNETDGSRIPVNDPIHDKKFFVVHAEANAILNANSATLKNTRLYTTLYPCSECAKLILQSGIMKIYYMYDTHADRAEYRASACMFAAAKIDCVRFESQLARVIIDLDVTQESKSDKNSSKKIDLFLQNRNFLPLFTATFVLLNFFYFLHVLKILRLLYLIN